MARASLYSVTSRLGRYLHHHFLLLLLLLRLLSLFSLLFGSPGLPAPLSCPISSLHNSPFMETPRNAFAASPALRLSRRPGFPGAVTRFCRRSYAADYIAFLCLLTGWILVGIDDDLFLCSSSTNILRRYSSSSTHSIACSTWITKPFNIHLPKWKGSQLVKPPSEPPPRCSWVQCGRLSTPELLRA